MALEVDPLAEALQRVAVQVGDAGDPWDGVPDGAGDDLCREARWWLLRHALSPRRCADEYTAALAGRRKLRVRVFASAGGAPLYSLDARRGQRSRVRCRRSGPHACHERRTSRSTAPTGSCPSRRPCSPTARSPCAGERIVAVGPPTDVIAAHPDGRGRRPRAAPSSCPASSTATATSSTRRFRGILDDEEFGDWIISLVDVKASLTPDEYLVSARLGALEAISSGHHHDRRHELQRG